MTRVRGWNVVVSLEEVAWNLSSSSKRKTPDHSPKSSCWVYEIATAFLVDQLHPLYPKVGCTAAGTDCLSTSQQRPIRVATLAEWYVVWLARLYLLLRWWLLYIVSCTVADYLTL